MHSHLEELVELTRGKTIDELKKFYKDHFGCLFKYNESLGLFCPMYIPSKTDFRKPGSLATRGTVFALENGTFQGQVVCVPFYKFFNEGEKHAYKGSEDEIVAIQEKHDGSLIKFFHHDSQWIVATNGTPIADDKFRLLFEKTVGMTKDEFGALLDTNNIYLFELTTPENKIVVVQTDYRLTLLLVRCKQTWDELPLIQYDLFDTVQQVEFNIDDENREGVVVVYKNGQRIKKKTKWYIDLHKTPKNGAAVERKMKDKYHVVKCIVNGTIDDYYGYLSNNQKRFVDKARVKLVKFEVLQVMKLKQIDPRLDLVKIEEKETVLIPLLDQFDQVFPERAVRCAVLDVLFGKYEQINYNTKLLKKLF